MLKQTCISSQESKILCHVTTDVKFFTGKKTVYSCGNKWECDGDNCGKWKTIIISVIITFI